MAQRSIDPVSLEVIWSRLIFVTKEQQDTLVRTAFSSIVRESQDLSCGVFDAAGRMIAQSDSGTPGHINSMANAVRHFLAKFPAEVLTAGDVLVTNDPWLTSGHLNDITVVTPVFAEHGVVALFANTCHSADIGGRILSAEAREVYEEGMRIPIIKLFDRGEANAVLLEMIRANVRQPDEVIGDLYAQAASNDTGGRALLELMNEFDLDSVGAVADEILRRSEVAVREAIRKLPQDVDYRSEAWCDGFEEPIVLRCSARASNDELAIDFEGSSPQTTRGINVPFNYTLAYASFAIKAVLCPEVPFNHGTFRPMRVSAPPGSILNALDPAPVASRHIIGHFVPSLIFMALAPALVGNLLAPGHDALWLSIWRGQSPSFSLTLQHSGGMGARPSKDGLSATCFPSGVAGVPVEVIENLSPLIVRRRELRTDSGGAGKWRGGLGQCIEFASREVGRWSVSCIVDRTRYAAPGLLGGGSGALGEVRISGAVTPKTKQQIELVKEDSVYLATPGGGGYGASFERDPERVRRDVVEGYVTKSAAARTYGVVILFSGREDELVRLDSQFTVDEQATQALRGG
jgi:N-methylhydantoinase B